MTNAVNGSAEVVAESVAESVTTSDERLAVSDERVSASDGRVADERLTVSSELNWPVTRSAEARITATENLAIVNIW